MKTMTTEMMESKITRISLMWITALLIVPCHSQDIPKIENLDCVNDFDRRMVCFWEVLNGGANCSSDFQFKYTDDVEKKTLYCPNLDNAYDGSFRIPNKCICNMTVEPIVISESYHIEVESQGRSVDKAVIKIYPSIKPKPPSNLRVIFDDPDNGALHWNHNYEYSFLAKELCFHIQFICKEDKVALEDVITQVETHYLFSKRQLKRGCEYSARVRMRVKKNMKLWSEWSPYVVFRNDYDLTIMDYKWLLISASCIVIIMLSVSCYFCITRTKERWWNNIPNPARSKLAESELIQKNHYLKPTGKSSAKTSCGNYLSKLVKAHKPKYIEFGQENLEKDYLNLMGKNIKIIFEPEKVDIERCIQLYPREDDNIHQTDLPEDKEEEIHLMAPDMSIGKMFCDILCDPSVTMDTMEQLQEHNTFGSFGSPILRDNSKSIERHLPLSIVSPESGYQSYDSDDSPGDSKSDGPNPLYLASLGQGDFLPYAPVYNIDETTCHMGKEEAFQNSGYNSFASALGEATSDVMEGDNISVFSLGTFFCKPSYHTSLQNPKSILYYNTRCFPSCKEDNLPPTLTPTLDCRLETHPTSASEEQGYQSFNQAVQQGDTSTSTTSLVFDSGYKPFESLTRFSTSSLDSIDGLSELDGDLVQMNEDPQQAGVVNGGTDVWNDTLSSSFPLTELSFFNRKYPFYSELIQDECKGLANQALNIHYAIKTLKEADKMLALTFDIGNHLSNFANMKGRKMSLGSEFPTNLIAYPCSLDEAPTTCDKLLDKNGTHTNKNFPMKFENMSYFGHLYHVRTESYSHLLVEENNMDKEGNSYMKIALW